MEQSFVHERYSRQLSLKGFGEKGQAKLRGARVLVVGAGGLGCPVLQYLAGAGVGEIGFADDDVVELSNLHRQVLYTMDDIGMPKVTRAEVRLRQLNPNVLLRSHHLRVNSGNALELLAGYDIVVDGTDNFAARYVLNDAAALLNKPLVFGGLYQYEGQVAVFNVRDAEGNQANYRHLFPVPPAAGEAPGCNEAGVLGLLPGVIGMLQAVEVVKLITGIGSPLLNQLLTYNLLTSESFVFRIDGTAVPEGMPADREIFMQTDYEWWCSGAPAGVEVMDAAVFRKLVRGSPIDRSATHESGKFAVADVAGSADVRKVDGLATRGDVLLVDVREKGEEPLVGFAHLSLPLSELPGELEVLVNTNQKNIVFFCQSGVRSMQAALMIRERLGGTKKLYTLASGLKGLAGG